MVNAGRRSKCCFTCRERRVKCDMQTPCCRRCTRSGRPCPGYPEPWGIMLRVQNNYAENKVQTRVKEAARQRIEQAKRGVAIIPRGVHVTAEMHSWNRFYRDYASDCGISLFNFLPKFYTSSSSACFQEALQAVALASSARQLHQSGLMVRARRHYGKAILALNVTLNDPVLTADDSVLVTLFLFSLFEIIVPECFANIPDAEFQCHIHCRGVLTLLRWRAERAQDSELDKSVFAFFCHIYLMSMFVNNEPFDVKWLVLEKFATPWTNGPLLEPILGRVVDFKRRAQTEITVSGHHPPRTEVVQLIKDGIAISEDLEATAISVKSSSNPDLPSHQQPTAFNNMFEVSTKTTEAIARSLYQTVRYHVVELVLGLLALIKEEGDRTRHETDYQFDPSMRFIILEQICEEICAVLGSDSKRDIEEDNTGMAYRAYGMFWPMIILLSSSLVEKEKRVWVHEKLRFSGDITGLGLATWAAERVNMLRPS